MALKAPVLAALLLLVAAVGSGVSADGLVNEEVKKTVDLSSHLAKMTAEIALSNQGHTGVQSFILAVEADLAPHLAYIGASVRQTSMNAMKRRLHICSLQPASCFTQLASLYDATCTCSLSLAALTCFIVRNNSSDAVVN